MRDRAEPPADVEAKPAPGLSVLHALPGDQPQIVQAHEPARLTLTARKRDLELAAEVLHVGVTQQELFEGLSVRRDVESLRTAHTGEVASRDVAHRVAASFARGDPHRGQASHEVGSVVNMDEVELDVLAGRHMGNPVRVVLSQLREHVHLLGRDLPVWDLDPDHARRVPHGFGALRFVLLIGQAPVLGPVVTLTVVVALAVDPAPETSLRKQPLVDLAPTSELHLHLEDLDLSTELVGDPPFQLLTPGAGRPCTLEHAFHHRSPSLRQRPPPHAHRRPPRRIRRCVRPSRLLPRFPAAAGPPRLR